MADPSRTAILLQRLEAGDDAASDELLGLVYGELRRLAGAQMRDQRAQHTLQPTALVHEAWLRLAGAGDDRPRTRGQFFALAARAMRSVLVDHARRKGAAKRGGDARRLLLEDVVLRARSGGLDLVELDDALADLAEVDEQAARVVEQRFFGGLTHEEIAALAGVSLSTVERRWRLARVFLFDRLGGAAEA